MANDKRISLDQLFALSHTIDDGRLFLQWVYDIGDWWSHGNVLLSTSETAVASLCLLMPRLHILSEEREDAYLKMLGAS